MAKKNKSKLKGSLEHIFKNLGQCESFIAKSFAKSFITELINMESYPHVKYSYIRPDYSEKAAPVADYLLFLDKLEWGFEIPDSQIKELLERPKEELAADLENFIINGLAAFSQFVEDEDSHIQPKFLVASLLLAEINLPQSLDVILELLRQDLDFIFIYFDESDSSILPWVIGRLGDSQLPKLMEFMKEPGLLASAKSHVSTAVSNIVLTAPERRMEVISWFCQVLNFFYNEIDDEAIFDGTVIDSMAYNLICIHAKETLPILEKIYNSELVMPFAAPDFEKIGEAMDNHIPTKKEPANVYEMLKKVNTPDDDEDRKDYSAFSIFDDFLQLLEDKMQANQRTLDASLTSKDTKCYSLRISLLDIEPTIWRQFEVPSSLPLAMLHEVIQVVMGWENCHLHQFLKERTSYVSPIQLEDSMEYGLSNEKDYSNITIGDLIKRKGAKIEYQYDFGDSWMHNIVLEKHRPYKKDEKRRICLIDGANAAPPEDCGGVWGYKELVESMKHKGSKAYKENVGWLGKPFNPTKFNKAAINKSLLKML